MKSNNLFKAIPFLCTFFLIFFLCFSNNKQYTKLRILIWNTPSLTLGTYLAISSGAGFILSYFVTTNIAKKIHTLPKRSMRFNNDVHLEDINDYAESNTEISYDNTLIERDIKDPSPTINASFRIIGKTEKINKDFANNNINFTHDYSNHIEEAYDEHTETNATIKQSNGISSDWNDESYTNW